MAILALAVLISAAAVAQPLERVWLHQFGTPQADNAYAVTAQSGVPYVAGGTQGSLLEPNLGMTDAFWAWGGPPLVFGDQFGSPGFDVALAMTRNFIGDRYTGGFTDGDLAGPNAGATDAFARFESQLGAWTRQFGTTANDSLRALAPVDFTDIPAVYGAGITRGSLGGPSAGGEDAWVARFDVVGTGVWTRQFGTPSDDLALAAASDLTGVYIAGYTAGDLGGPNAGSLDAFLARYNADGDQAWLRQFGSSSYDQAVAACSDGSGGVYVAGGTGGELGGPAAGSRDAFIARYDSSGTSLWVRQFGTGTFDDIAAICPDGEGGVFVAGYTFGNLAGPNQGSRDIFLARYTAAGDRTAITQFGSPADDSVAGVARDMGGFFVTGSTLGTLGAQAFGGGDAWVAFYRFTCDPDINADGNTDQEDVACIINAVAGDPACSAQDTDFNRDGNVDQEDVVAVISAVAGGGCP